MTLPTNTEFYLSLLPILTGLLLVIIGAIKGDQAMINTGLAAMAGATGLYSVGRGLAKISTTGPDGRTPVPSSADEAARVISGLPK